jgi:hypothetical protein
MAKRCAPTPESGYEDTDSTGGSPGNPLPKSRPIWGAGYHCRLHDSDPCVRKPADGRLDGLGR